MRQDNIQLPNPPRDDRPGDAWMQDPNGDSSGMRVLTWSGKRRRFALWFWIVVAVSSALLWCVVPRSALFKPGELSGPHAQILAGSVASQRCAACHVDASLSPLEWMSGAGDSHLGVTQSDLCLDCHHRTIDQNLAFSAHNLPLSVRDELSEAIRLASKSSDSEVQILKYHRIPDTAVDQNHVECAVCHKEHHRAEANLLALSDQQCQSCHTGRFGSFADSHPDWKQWPYGRGGEIMFNHATHQQKHFPGWKSGIEKFDCAVCHPDAASTDRNPAIRSGELVRVASYENSCMVCHDESMNVQLAQGVELVALPTVPQSIADQVDGWPERATGYPDGIVSPLAELLLRSDPSVANLMRRIPERDLSRQGKPDEQSGKQLLHLASEVQRLIKEVGDLGHTAIRSRLASLGISSGPLQPMFRSLSPQLVGSANRAWFGGTEKSPKASLAWSIGDSSLRLVAADDDDLLGGSLLDGSLLGEASAESEDGLLGGELLADPLDADPLSPQTVEAIDADVITDVRELMADGGWYRDDQQFAIRYLGHSHADPVMVALIETFGQLSDSDPVKKRFFTGTAAASCVSCHSTATSVPARWTASTKVGRRTEFTKFAHRPHLNVSELGDCVHCHQIGQAADTVSASVDFHSLGRETCAACHSAKAAGDNCTQCHRYHIQHP